MYFLAFKITSGRCYTYKDILLKTFIEISNTGDLKLLLRRGVAPQEYLVEVWEGIISDNSKATNNGGYSEYFQLLKGYDLLISEYVFVRATLIKLLMKVDHEDVKELSSRGYRISTKDSEGYAESIYNSLRKVDNLITKSEMKRKEIDRNFSGKEKTGKSEFVDVIAGLEIALERQIEDNITLAKYNALCKLAKRKNEQAEKALNKRK